MPKQKVKYFQVTVKVYEDVLRDSYSRASDTKNLVSVAIIGLAEDGIFIEDIEEVTSDQGIK